jgi:nucleoside 2-deoxyribosyltransferase
MKKDMKLYLAHPITSLSGNQVMDYYMNMQVLLEEDYEILCPMVGKTWAKEENQFKPGGYEYPVSTNHAIAERDLWMVQQADVVLVDFSECEKINSIGCISELAWAHQARKHTIVVVPGGDFVVHAFIQEEADIIFHDLRAAIDYLKGLSKGINAENCPA